MYDYNNQINNKNNNNNRDKNWHNYWTTPEQVTLVKEISADEIWLAKVKTSNDYTFFDNEKQKVISAKNGVMQDLQTMKF